MSISIFSPAKRPSDRGLIPTRVLVVDDEPLIGWSICTALATAGFDAVAATTLDEARRLAGEWPPPKVALFDVRPDGGGREAMREIRSIYPTCFVIAMSTAPRERVTWLPQDVTGVIEKPFDIARLVARVVELARDDDGPVV